MQRAAFSRRKIYGSRGELYRESRWTIIRYNRDNEILLRHVRALTGKNPSNAARRRRDVRPSLIQRVDLATLRSLISARSFINPRSPQIIDRRLRTKDRNEAKETSFGETAQDMPCAPLISRNLVSDHWWFTGTHRRYLSNLRTYGTVMTHPSPPAKYPSTPSPPLSRVSAKSHKSRKSGTKEIRDAYNRWRLFRAFKSALTIPASFN